MIRESCCIMRALLIDLVRLNPVPTNSRRAEALFNKSLRTPVPRAIGQYACAICLYEKIKCNLF